MEGIAMKSYDIDVQGATLTVGIDEYDGDEFAEKRITSDDNLIKLLQRVAAQGWDAYDEIMERVDTARKEAREEPL
jgi:hypothetical protein